MVFEDGSAVVNALMTTKDLIGYPLQPLNAEGVRERSFGSESGEFDPAEPYLDPAAGEDLAGFAETAADGTPRYVIWRFLIDP